MVWGYIASTFLGVLGGSEEGVDLKTLLSLIVVLAIVFIAVNLYLNFTDQTITEALGLDRLFENYFSTLGNNLLKYTPAGWLFGIGTGIGSAIFQRR